MKQVIGVILMTIITILGAAGYIPQIVKMCRTKSAADISDGTWWMYTVGSALYVAYLLYVSFDLLIFIEAMVELLLNVTTLYLDVHYSRKQKGE